MTEQKTPLSPLQQFQERKAGIEFTETQVARFEKACLECPPINAQLIKHLEKMFSSPVNNLRPGDPMLAQHLMVTYGVEQVLTYLRKRLAEQTAAARKGRTI